MQDVVDLVEPLLHRKLPVQGLVGRAEVVPLRLARREHGVHDCGRTVQRRSGAGESKIFSDFFSPSVRWPTNPRCRGSTRSAISSQWVSQLPRAPLRLLYLAQSSSILVHDVSYVHRRGWGQPNPVSATINTRPQSSRPKLRLKIQRRHCLKSARS